MHNQQRSRTRRNIALLVAVSVALYGLDAQAAEPSEEAVGHVKVVKERTVADIVNEARARVEADKRPYSEWQGYKKEQPANKQPEKPKPRSWYVGFGTENNVSYSMRELYRVRSAQIQAFPLEYLEPADTPYQNFDPGGFSLFIGRELTDWLDVELSSFGEQSFYQLMSEREVARTTMTPDNPRDTEATQYTSFYERTLSLSLLPRWNINRYIALYGRLGLGYSDSKFDSRLSISAYVPGPVSCTKDPGTGRETCRETTQHETRYLDWKKYDNKGDFFPIVGAGIRFFGGVRFEYIYRSGMPIGDTTTDISGSTFSLCWRSEWR